MKPMAEADFQMISEIARKEAGLFFPITKRVFVSSRLQRRLRATGRPSFSEYARFLLRSDPVSAQERKELVSALTTNVTGIFREPHHFDILYRLLQKKSSDQSGLRRPIRIWSAGCSSGEEAFSIAATCRLVFGPQWSDHVRILGTDIDETVLRRAVNLGENQFILKRLQSGVAHLTGNCRGTSDLTISDLNYGITFMRQNVLVPLPVSRPFDVIFCRNVMIYFAPDIQSRVQLQLKDRLADGGLLLLGHSERLLAPSPDIQLIGATSYIKSTNKINGDDACL
ncbi:MULTISPECIES: protein-glutamate O-methyltransferase CheR [Jannaschia]|uniref:CheR family methyltransferase n=1 Tax=Jannaschia TaxID=188905 RepID=UPI001C7DC5A3|nr:MULTISPECIES: CheR family methyltransferase [unclassified Jannaschia]